jgi:ATP-dependent RNA helicase DDX27
LEDSEDSSEDSEAFANKRSDDEQVESPFANRLDEDGSASDDELDEEGEDDAARKAAFFADDTVETEEHSSFSTMNLSRPILKGLASLGFNKPTPIQSATIPVALMGKDIVGGAVTGSGKTAAFIVPMLERLLYRDKGKKAAATRCLILVPTRELAVQCFEVTKKIAASTDIQTCLIVGEWLKLKILCCSSAATGSLS